MADSVRRSDPRLFFRSERAAERLRQLPVRAGEAPYGVKGVAYRGHLDYCARFIPGGNHAAVARLGRADVVEFFAQPFLASSHYDVFPLVLAGVGCAEVMGQPFLEFVQTRSQYQVEQDIRGVYKTLLGAASIETVASRMPRVLTTYFDFGEVVIEESGANRVRWQLVDIPRAFGDWFEVVATTYLHALLTNSGAKNVKITWEEPERAADPGPFDMVSLRCDTSWAR